MSYVVFILYVNVQFRAARKVAEEVGAQIVLGDRPIEITVCLENMGLRGPASDWNFRASAN